MDYRPEGYRFKTAENQRYIATLEGLTEAMRQGIILESRAAVCSGGHDLIVDLPCAQGIIPRNEGAVGISEGKTRDIALISRVGKPVCFKVTEPPLEITSPLLISDFTSSQASSFVST